MSKIDVRQYIPPNLRDYALYETVSDVLTRTLDTAYYSDYDKLRGLYNPLSEAYDPEYLISVLGPSSLSALLSDDFDNTALSLIVPGLNNLKGTERGFETVLKLLRIKYSQILINRLDNGCSDITIIYDKTERITPEDIRHLDKLANEILPLCATLRGVTNCYVYDQIAGNSAFTLGQQRLSRDFVLGLSKLDTSFGVTDPLISSTISALLCNLISVDIDISAEIIVRDNITRYRSANAISYIRPTIFLSDNLFLGHFDSISYNRPFKGLVVDTLLTGLRSHEIDFSNITLDTLLSREIHSSTTFHFIVDLSGITLDSEHTSLVDSMDYSQISNSQYMQLF